MDKNTFRKRYIKTVTDFFKEIIKVFKSIINIKKYNKTIISPEFQEKIMLAVCGVNSCVNCSYLHSKYALENGINENEIRNLLKGELGDFPEHEAVALAYSQHWAESDGCPTEKAKEKLIEYYGKQKARIIENFIQLVTFGNLISNTIEAYKFNPYITGFRFQFLLTYIFCWPMAKLIYIGGRKGKKYFSEKKIDLFN